jgi:DNA polymerase (family X)
LENDEQRVHVRIAKEKGLKVVISADAHTKTDLHYLRFGVYQARRGWLEPNDVLNTRKWTEIKKLLRRG